MRAAVYNAAIPNIIANSVNRVLRPACRLRVVMKISCVLLGCALLVQALGAQAAEWSGPEQQLARKIVAVTGQGSVGPVILTVENRSSLGKRDSEVIQNGLRSALEGLGVHIVRSEAASSPGNSRTNSSPSNSSQSSTSVKVSLSENSASYVWVAEIRKGAVEPVMVMVTAPRPEGTTAGYETVPLSLRKTLLFAQDDPILDLVVLEENATPTRIAVLDAEKISTYRSQGGKWQLEQGLTVIHGRPWPRDLRGRLVAAKDHSLDAYLPGVLCRAAGAPLTLSCRESDDPWPLLPAAWSSGGASVFPSAGSTAATIPAVGAFYAASRNFFTGALTAGIGTFSAVPKFYSTALVPRDKSMLWLFAAVDGRVHLIDGMSDQTTTGLDWGSDLTSVKTACGAAWQVLATSSDDAGGDSVRAYEFPDRDPVAVSAAVDFAGAVTALWTEAKGDTAIVVVRNRETGSYEVFRLAVACSQ
jgi:hypothetical protein